MPAAVFIGPSAESHRKARRVIRSGTAAGHCAKPPFFPQLSPGKYLVRRLLSAEARMLRSFLKIFGPGAGSRASR
jgi:hypothetical protein